MSGFSAAACRVLGWMTVVSLAAGCGMPETGRATPQANVVALVGGRVQPSPDAAPIPDGVVLIGDGVIAAVGSRGAIPVPPGAVVIDCAGGTVMSGFWNSHVHFTGPAFQQADARRPVSSATPCARC
jgi:imidazolonepropionase-like amidohydrolase